MNKIFYRLMSVALAFMLMFGIFAEARAQWTPTLNLVANMNMPVQHVVVYNPQSVSYTNFSAGIFAQGQLSEVAKLPGGSEVSLYIDTNRLNGPVGLGIGTRCSAAQASTDYYKNTITMDKRFCPDFNDAILDGRSVYGMIPTEDAFIHKANGERCSWVGFGGETYMINPASPFVRNYIVMRGAEKLTEYGLSTLFLDDLRAGWASLTSKCGGNPKEYLNLNDYASQMLELARYVTVNLPNYKIQGNLGDATPVAWDDYSFLDGAMCESCFSDWTRAWPSATQMLSDLSVIDKWVQGGHKIYMVVQAPDTSVTSNRFAFAAALLSARDDGANVYFHFGADYSQFYAIPEYQYILGTPTAAYVCSGNICTRQFQYGTVRVDFGTHEGIILLATATVASLTSTAQGPTLTPIPASPTATKTTIAPTAILPSTTPTVIPVSPTATKTTIAPTAILPSATPTVIPVSPTATQRATNPPATLTQIPITPTTALIVNASLKVRIKRGSDDVEERSGGSMYMTSTDLGMVYDTSTQVIGLRFTGINIPKNATITSAFIQFKVDETTSNTTSLVIQGEASPNAAAFNTVTRNVSSRVRTKSAVIWTPVVWTTLGASGEDQRTPNLASVIQQIVSQSGWKSGNSLVLIITGSGERVAESYEGDAAGAPILHITYTVP